MARWAGHRFRKEMVNWRLAMVRILTSGVAVVVTITVVPGLWFTGRSFGEFFLIGLVFGLLNALIKPVLQFFTLRYLLPSFGLVVILINALMLAGLSWILGGEIDGRGVLSWLFGGLLVGILGLILDAMFGTTVPILDRSGVEFDTSSRSSSTPDPVPAAQVSAAAAAVLAGRDPDQPAPPAESSPTDAEEVQP